MMLRRKIIAIAALSAISIGLGACAIQRAQEAAKVKASMVGMPREQVLSCMGAPASAAKAGNTEVWSYNSGNGETDTFGSAYGTRGWGWASAFGASTSTSRYCKVDIVMSSGRVSRVNYSGPTGGLLTEGEQCAYAVDNCAQEATTMPVSAQAETPVPQPNVSAQPKASTSSSKDDEAVKKWARENGYQYGNSAQPSN